MKYLILALTIVSSPALAFTSYNEQTFGNQRYGNGYDSNTGESIRTHSMDVGNMRIDTINQGGKQTRCTTQTFGTQTYTNCY